MIILTNVLPASKLMASVVASAWHVRMIYAMSAVMMLTRVRVVLMAMERVEGCASLVVIVDA